VWGSCGASRLDRPFPVRSASKGFRPRSHSSIEPQTKDLEQQEDISSAFMSLIRLMLCSLNTSFSKMASRLGCIETQTHFRVPHISVLTLVTFVSCVDSCFCFPLPYYMDIEMPTNLMRNSNLMSTHKRKRPETPDQNTGFLHDLEATVNALRDEVTFVRTAMAKREKICLVPTCKQTFRRP
jgi:hypothetical protein